METRTDNTLQRIYTAALKFLFPSTLQETYETIVREALKLVDVNEGAIYLENANSFKPVYATNPKVYKITPRKGGNTYKAFRGQKTIIANVTRFHPELKKAGAKSSIFIPLSYQRKAIGVMTLDSKNKEYFDDKKKNTLVLFGSLASLAIKKAQLYEETIRALQTRDLFISMAAHELRTPLTSVNGYIQLLKSKIRRKRDVPTKWIDDLEFEAKRLQKLVEEFLEINRIRTGKLQYNFKQCGLKDIIKSALSTFHFNKPERRVTFVDRIPSKKEEIVGDREKLVQVLVNILENADKYSSTSKEIVLTLKETDESYILKVQDKGQGIAEKDIPLIFEGFYKGKNSMHEGMGLGLYLAKNIIDMHQGDISIKSRVNKGTRVIIKLPKAKILN